MATVTQSAGIVPSENRYLDLVRTFPLRPIRSGEEHDRAIAIVDELSDRKPGMTAEERDYFLVLCLLIERYESEIYPET